jgi:hypothetical protein
VSKAEKPAQVDEKVGQGRTPPYLASSLLTKKKFYKNLRQVVLQIWNVNFWQVSRVPGSK